MLCGLQFACHRCIQNVPAAIGTESCVATSRTGAEDTADSSGVATPTTAGGREQLLTKANVRIAKDDAEAGKQLFRDLKEVCATGVAPDFSDTGALHYYTLQVRWHAEYLWPYALRVPDPLCMVLAFGSV